MQMSPKAEFEMVPKSDLYSFSFRELKLPAFPSVWHFHPECELTYVVRGQGTRFVGDNISPFAAGDLVLLGSNLPHCWKNDAPAKGSKLVAHCLVIHFRPECLGADFFSRPEMDAVRRLLLRARRGIRFSGRCCGRVSETMGKMSNRSGLERIIELLRIFEMLLEAEGYQVLSSAGFSPSVDELAAERISSAYRYIFDHLSSPLDHAEIARRAGMSQSGFCHYFRRVTGRTVSDFTNEVRVGHASKLLIDTKQRISEIAYASGYETLSNFNRRFRDLTGLNPREYRNKYQSSLGSDPMAQAEGRTSTPSGKAGGA